jgi:hypothetical protein
MTDLYLFQRALAALVIVSGLCVGNSLFVLFLCGFFAGSVEVITLARVTLVWLLLVAGVVGLHQFVWRANL